MSESKVFVPTPTVIKRRSSDRSMRLYSDSSLLYHSDELGSSGRVRPPPLELTRMLTVQPPIKHGQSALRLVVRHKVTRLVHDNIRQISVILEVSTLDLAPVADEPGFQLDLVVLLLTGPFERFGPGAVADVVADKVALAAVRQHTHVVGEDVGYGPGGLARAIARLGKVGIDVVGAPDEDAVVLVTGTLAVDSEGKFGGVSLRNAATQSSSSYLDGCCQS